MTDNPTPTEAELAASRDRVDAAVLAHRAEPTEANEAAVLAAMAEHHELFLRHQTIDYQARTHGGRFTDWTHDNVVIHHPGRSAVYEDHAPQRRTGDPYPPD